MNRTLRPEDVPERHPSGWVVFGTEGNEGEAVTDPPDAVEEERERRLRDVQCKE